LSIAFVLCLQSVELLLYHMKHVNDTARFIKEFEGGHAVFTQPATPIKCAGGEIIILKRGVLLLLITILSIHKPLKKLCIALKKP
jgi:hypothetical protein